MTAEFALIRGVSAIASVPIRADEVSVASSDVVISELQDCSFRVMGVEPDERFLVRVGDLPADPMLGAAPAIPPGEGMRFGDVVQWPGGFYFESARGETAVRLFGRTTAGTWRARAELRVVVAPDKLGEERYQAMYDALSRLAAGFVYDLVSKSVRRLDLGAGAAGIATGSAQVRLRFLAGIWRETATLLRAIQRDPVRSLRRSVTRRQLWGSEALRERTLLDLASAGASRGAMALPVPAVTDELVESTNTVEHRVMAGFMRMLSSRIADCSADAEATVGAVQADRTLFRAHAAEDLFSIRLERLREAIDQASTLREDIGATLRRSFFRSLALDATIRRTPVFENVPTYRALWAVMQRFLRHAAFVVDSGSSERVKATWRMYEQWIFFQVAAALHDLGGRCEEHVGVLQQRSRYRFTLDLDAGSRLSFVAPDGTPIVLTYEPLIFSLNDAKARRDSLFRGRTGEMPWTPDILVEVLEGRPAPGDVPRVRYAFVIDAKYSRRIEQHHWTRVEKYKEIRSVATQSQVVRHVWLAFPSDAVGVEPRDEFVTWTTQGPSTPPDETVFGTVGVLPDADADQPSASLVTLLGGMLRYFGVETR